VSIYTKTGDAGQTGLLSGKRVAKDDARVAVSGDLDELNAALGLARAQGLESSIAASVMRIQRELFTLGAQLSAAEKAAHSTGSGQAHPTIPQLGADWTSVLEREIDAADAELTELHGFILPGGSPGGAALHLARSICRRAERSLVTLARAEAVDPAFREGDQPVAPTRDAVEPALLVYINRLSDWLFTMARLANHHAGTHEPLWQSRS